MNRLVDARNLFEYVIFRLLAALIRALPLEVASRWLGVGWRVIAPRLRRHRRALDNLALALPETSLAERERIARDMWENLGRTFAEFFFLHEIEAEGRAQPESPDQVRAIAAAGPFVACSMHMGNWEAVSAIGARYGAKLAGVYQKLHNPLVDRYVYTMRAPGYPGGLYDKSPAMMRAFLRIPRKGGCPAFLADLHEGRGIQTTFFGMPALANPFPAQLARTLGLPLYAVRVLRLPGVRFSVRVVPVEVPRTDDRDADVAAATAAMHARFEQFIREAPGQWMWAHRRWR
jgi:KDO2-lipid IV(A) lauroyltransferase